MDGSYSALIVDSNDFLMNSSQGELDFSSFPGPAPWVTSDHEEALTVLANQSHYFPTMMINPALPHPFGLSFIQQARQCRPVTPLRLLYDQTIPFSDRELGQLGAQGVVSRSSLAHEIYGYSKKILEFEKLILSLRTSEEPFTGEILQTQSGKKFLAISVRDFLICEKSLFDVFIRISNGRYLKILSANDSFSMERLTRYIEKGATYFYLSHPAYQRALSYCDRLARSLLRESGVSSEMKIVHTLNEGQKLTEKIREGSILQNPKFLDQAAEFVASTFYLAQTLQNDKNLGEFLERKTPLFEHAVGVTLVSSLVSLALNFESAQAIQSVGLAAFFHDIGLYSFPDELQSEVVSEMTPEQLQVFETHPEKGAEILRNIRGVDDRVIQAVLQHHLRRNNSGFPRFQGTPKVSPLAEIVGISDEYVRLLRAKQYSPELEPLYFMHTEVFDGFSYPIVEAFNKAIGQPHSFQRI